MGVAALPETSASSAISARYSRSLTSRWERPTSSTVPSRSGTEVRVCPSQVDRCTTAGTRGSAPSPPVSAEGRRRAWGGSSPRPVRPPQPAYRLVGVGNRAPTSFGHSRSGRADDIETDQLLERLINSAARSATGLCAQRLFPVPNLEKWIRTYSSRTTTGTCWIVLLANPPRFQSCSVGCRRPDASLARTHSVCWPGRASQTQVQAHQSHRGALLSTVARCQVRPPSLLTSIVVIGA